MVEKDFRKLKPRYVVKPGIKTFVVGALCTLLFTGSLISLVLYGGYDLYIIGMMLGFPFSVFYYWQIIAIRITVYHGYVTIRDFSFTTRTFKTGEIYLLEVPEGFYGDDQIEILDSEQKKIVTISSFCINFDNFYQLMKRKGRLITRKQALNKMREKKN